MKNFKNQLNYNKEIKSIFFLFFLLQNYFFFINSFENENKELKDKY